MRGCINTSFTNPQFKEVNVRRSIVGAIIFVMASLVAFGQTASPSDGAQDRKELQQLDRDAHRDKQDARSDLNDMQQDRADLRTAIKDGDKAAATKDLKDLHQDNRDLSKDKKNLRKDVRKARQVERQTRMRASTMGPRAGRH